MIQFYFILLLTIYSSFGFSTDVHYTPETISTKNLVDFQSNSTKVKTLIEMGLQLTQRKLTYQYGSADPILGGMDCSGTMYYLLTKFGIESVPRSSDNLYSWIKRKGVFYSVNRGFTHLHPGDLLFWTGTYQAPGNSYVTHVMMYIGKNVKGESLMLGSSDGRTYKGKKIYGVSVFDFLPPSSSSDNKFLGYSCIPQVSC